jgi:hypothetical protein
MTRLRPLVVPVAALTLATAAPSATAQPRRPVVKWADSPSALMLAAEHANLPSHAALIQPAATSLPLAVLATPAEAAAIPDGRFAVAAHPAAADATGRPIRRSARGPP